MRTADARAPFFALATGLAVAVVAALILYPGSAPGLLTLFSGPGTSSWALGALLNASAPLLLAGLGSSLAFRAGIFNLGGEGQAALGMLAGALQLHASLSLPPVLALLLAMTTAVLAGAALAALSALAERFRGASVLLTSFLVSQTTLIAIEWALGGPLKEPASNLLGMAPLPARLLLGRLGILGPMTAALPLALVLVLAAWVYVHGTRFGYELTIFGHSRPFSRAQGLTRGLSFTPLALSGGCLGLAGFLALVGGGGQAIQGLTAGLGWNGLAVSLIAVNDPRWLLPATLLFSWLEAGARQAAIRTDLPQEVAGIIWALALVFVTSRSARPALRRGPKTWIRRLTPFPFRRGAP